MQRDQGLGMLIPIAESRYVQEYKIVRTVT